MDPNVHDIHTWVGTIGGFLLVLLTELNSSDMIRTAVLALIGGVVSFTVSKGLRWLARHLKNH